MDAIAIAVAYGGSGLLIAIFVLTTIYTPDEVFGQRTITKAPAEGRLLRGDRTTYERVPLSEVAPLPTLVDGGEPPRVVIGSPSPDKPVRMIFDPAAYSLMARWNQGSGYFRCCTEAVDPVNEECVVVEHLEETTKDYVGTVALGWVDESTGEVVAHRMRSCEFFGADTTFYVEEIVP